MARWTRLAFIETLGRGAAAITCRPEVRNLDRLEDLEGRAIFVTNHHSHLDTTLLLTTIPRPWRHEMVVAAAADYFFDTRPKAALAAWAYGAVPMERQKVSRRGADASAADLIEDGWSLLIFPEGGRTPDGWGQPHKGGAAYLAVRCGVPVVPIHLDGTGRVLPKGKSVPDPADRRGQLRRTHVAPTTTRTPDGSAARLERAIAELADETDHPTGGPLARRAHAGATPRACADRDLTSWRRDWLSPDRRPRVADETPRWPPRSDRFGSRS